MDSKILIDITAIIGLVAVIFKGIDAFYKDKKNMHADSVDDLVNKCVDSKISMLSNRLDDLQKEFNKGLLEIFKNFK